jgi:hypothetical protein
LTTSSAPPARRWAAAIAVAVGAALAAAPGRASAQPAPGAPGGGGGDGSPIVFFWSAPSPTDASLRAALLPAIDRAARAAGGTSVDLSRPLPAPPALAEKVAAAIASYEAMRYPEAISALDQAAAAAAERGAVDLTRDQLVDLFLYRALGETEMNNTSAAWSDFVRAATIDPTRVLNPARFRPSALKAFERAVQAVTARPSVDLTVTAPAGSRIRIDARQIGRDQARESLRPGEHYLWVERPTAAPYARLVTLSAALALAVPDEAAAPPDDVDLRRRAARLGSGPPLLCALRRDGGVALVELRSIGPRRSAVAGMVRLGPSPAADARDVEAAVTRALARIRARLDDGGPIGPRKPERARWYQSRWFWLAVGAVGAMTAATPFLLDRGSGPSRTDAALDTGGLGP